MMKVLAVIALVGCVAFAQQDQGPPFLQGAAPAVLQSFNAVLASSGGLTDAQVDAKVEGWVKTQSPQIQRAFADFKKQVDASQKQGEVAHQAAVSKFSPAAKAADAQLSKIANDNSLSVEKKGQQIDAILANLEKTNPAAAREIQQAMQG